MTNETDDSARLREEAQRETEKALERERLQKKEREEQHATVVRGKIRQLEEQVRRTERDLGAIELEAGRLDHMVRESRTTTSSSTKTNISALERLIREVTSKLTRVKDEERTLTEELQKDTRDLADARSKERTEEREEQTRSEHGRTAAARKAEHDRKKETLTREIEGFKREISQLTREL